MNTTASENPCLRCPKLAPVPGACETFEPGSPPGAMTPVAAARMAEGCGIAPRAFALRGSKYR